MRVALATRLLEEGAADLDRAAQLQPASMEAANAAALLHRTLGRDERAASWRRQGLTEVQATAAAAAAVAAPDSGGGDNGGRGGALQADGNSGLLASGAYDWRQLSHSLHTSGHAVIDRVLGGGAAAALRRELQNLEPLMRQGRVGHGVQSGAVRTDVLWRHKRGEGTVVNSTAPHMAALHALFDALPLGLNGVDGGGPAGGAEAGTCAADAPRLASPAWALTHAEDLQFACYHPGGYYRRHSDAQNASRRVLTAIYYPNGAWRPSDGGRLRLYLPRRARAAAGVGVKAREEEEEEDNEEGRGEVEGAAPPHVDVDPIADRLVVFDSRLEHEVLPVAAARSAAAGSAAAVEAKKAGKKAGKKAKSKAKPTDAAAPRPRCAFTQWFQDLAPPLLASAALRPQRIEPSVSS